MNTNKINSNIIGYELVKNVVKAEGYEYCRQDKLFAVRRGCDDYMEALCEVRENTRENFAELEAKYPFEEGYIIWFGTVNYDLSSDVPQDEIEFYWS